jgi:hypothetical protein
MLNTIVLTFSLHQELERAKSEDVKEEIANLNSKFMFSRSVQPSSPFADGWSE